MQLVMWHPFVTCGHCGHLQECARLVDEACSFSVLCHGCEGLLTVTIAADQIAERRRSDLTDAHLVVRGAVMRNRTCS